MRVIVDRSILSEFAKSLGKGRVVDDLQATDLQRYRAILAKRLGVHALKGLHPVPHKKGNKEGRNQIN